MQASVKWAVMRRGSLTVCLALLQGCSLFNPHVGSDITRPQVTADKSNFAGSLPEAIDYANDFRKAYYKAVGEQSKLRNGLALTLVPISATALFLGITSSSRASRDAITALGITGASAFALGAQFESNWRQRIYLAGSQVIGCAILAMRPYLIPTAEFNSFKAQLKKITPAIGIVENDINNLNRQISIVDAKHEKERKAPPAILEEARAAVRFAETLIAKARKVESNGFLVEYKIEKGGITLVTTTDTIRDSVSVQVTKTEPSIESLAGILGGLRLSTQQFITLAQVPKSTAPVAMKGKEAGEVESSEESVLRSRMSMLQNNANALSGFANDVVVLVNKVSLTSKTVGEIEDCRLGEIASGFTVRPDVSSVSMKVGQKHQFAVSGGAGIPRAIFVGPAPKGIKLETQVSTGNFIAIVEILADAGAGEYSLWLSDATGTQGKTISINVSSAPSKPDQQSTIKTFQSGLSEQSIRAIQAVLELTGSGSTDLDGKIGSKTIAAMKAFAEKQGKEWKGEITQQLADEVWKVSQDGLTEFERALKPEESKEYQAKYLKVTSATGKFDERVRRSILELEEKHGLKLTGGLSKELDTKLKA